MSVSAVEPRPGDDVRGLLGQLQILESLGDELWLLGSDQKFVYVNRTDREPLLGTSALDFVPPTARDDFESAFAAARSEGVAHTCEIRWADATCSESRLVPVTDPRGAKYMLVTTRDITAAKVAEATRRETENRLQSALDASGVGTWSWSMLTGKVVWDARMCEICGLTSAPASYAMYLELVHPDDLERVKSLVGQFLTSGHFEEFEHRMIRPSGEVRHLQCCAIAVGDVDGTTIEMRGAVSDVTDRKLLEERLRNVDRLQAVGQLTAGIAHNFNNLLGIILPNVELCRHVLPGVGSVYLDDIEDAAERAAEMVRQLMQFGRPDLGAPKRAVALQAIVRRLLHICRTTFEPRIVIACELPTEPLPISASAGEVEQVLLNVCINARDALTAANVASPVIRIEVERVPTGFMRVRITDNGPGMRSEVRARIFEPFFTTKGVGRGTGLGLASAYGIMRDHGGTIVCDTEPGKGTSFTIELPAAPESALDAPRRKSGAPDAVNTEMILLVDDELALRRVLRIILEQAGFRVIEAQDGMAAYEFVLSRREEIDLVVLDRSMPRMSGEQFLFELRRRNIQLPIVILTGHGNDDAPPEGVAAVLLKPAAAGELVRTIRSVLDRTRVIALA